MLKERLRHGALSCRDSLMVFTKDVANGMMEISHNGLAMLGLAVVLLGAFVGQSVWAMRGLDPIFQVLRTVPPLAWLPLSLAAFRDGQPSAIFVIFITAIWPIIINTAVGIRNIPQDYRNVAKVLRLNQFEFFTKIMVPAAAPPSDTTPTFEMPCSAR